MQNNNDNTNALLIHLSAFIGYLLPLGSIIAPLILWHTSKNKSLFLNEHGKESVNFNISFGIYLFALSSILLIFFFGFFFDFFLDIFNGTAINFDANNSITSFLFFLGIASIISIFSLIKIILIIIASIKAYKGEIYHYPFTINFIK